MKDRKISVLKGAGPAHLIYHAIVLASIITILMIVMWTVLLCLQRMPTNDLNQLPSFFTFLLISVAGIASMVFAISLSAAVIGLWLKCGLSHSYFYRLTIKDVFQYEALRKHLTELNFVFIESDLLIRDNLLVNLNTNDNSWVLILRPRAWNPNLKVNQELKKVAWSLQEFTQSL